MQSLYKVIKKHSIVKEGFKKIVTEFEDKEKVQQKELIETNARIFIDSYENLAKTMIENAKKQRDEIFSSAYTEAEKLQKEAYNKAYEKGYKEGVKQGYDKAYEDGYQNNVNKALAEGENIKNNADNVLKACIAEKERYIREKEDEIKKLVINCVENILKREVKDKDAMNSLIFEALSQVKNSKTFIIKSKKIYCDSFNQQIETWKEQLPFKGDIFVVPDESIEEGKVIIDRDKGKIIVGVDIAMEKVREIVYSVE